MRVRNVNIIFDYGKKKKSVSQKGKTVSRKSSIKCLLFVMKNLGVDFIISLRNISSLLIFIKDLNRNSKLFMKVTREGLSRWLDDEYMHQVSSPNDDIL